MRNKWNILVTGSAGFIGYHMVKRLSGENIRVTGIDNLNDYYDPSIKLARLTGSGIEPTAAVISGRQISSGLFPDYQFIRMDLEDKDALSSLFRSERFTHVIHLAAQPGVRYSLINPWSYVHANVFGTLNILEACREIPPVHLVFASSSSVYGLTATAPFSAGQPADQPVSMYAATKRSAELMAYTYSHLFRFPVTGLRFFTVYGPWGRPDMAYFRFVRNILAGDPIEVFNHGELTRDFTYIDDITEGVFRVTEHPPETPDTPGEVPFAIYNIGNSTPVKLMEFISILETLLKKKAILNFREMQPGDVLMTHADVTPLKETFGYKPSTLLEEGLSHFITWYHSYFH
jgi:UDP-glucuronate 4-epimerase